MDPAPSAAKSRRRTTAALVILACLSTPGCVTPLAHGWADFKAKREVDQAAADDSFPNAAEVGLASTEATAKSD